MERAGHNGFMCILAHRDMMMMMLMMRESGEYTDFSLLQNINRIA